MALTPTNKSSRNDKSFSAAIKDSINPRKNVSKGGRPSKGPVKKISLSIPEELLDGIDLASTLLHKGNKTEYIISLIREDLKVNSEKYAAFKEMMNR